MGFNFDGVLLRRRQVLRQRPASAEVAQRLPLAVPPSQAQTILVARVVAESPLLLQVK